MKIYFARDENGTLCSYPSKPKKCKTGGFWFAAWPRTQKKGIMPFVKWEDDEPLEIDIDLP